MKSSHYEATLSDRENQYCLISGVVAWKDWRVGAATLAKIRKRKSEVARNNNTN